MNDFLPKDYKEPVINNYMGFVEGENTFRILSPAVTGVEYWIDGVKPDGTNGAVPKRVKTLAEIPPGTKFSVHPKYGEQKPKGFWAFVVWNYVDERVQVLQLTQKTIKDGIMGLYNNKKWGDPKGYDIVVKKTIEDEKTKYAVFPEPHSEVTKEVQELYKKTYINLEALFAAGDPFTQVTSEDVDPDSVNI